MDSCSALDKRKRCLGDWIPSNKISSGDQESWSGNHCPLPGMLISRGFLFRRVADEKFEDKGLKGKTSSTLYIVLTKTEIA